MEYSNISPYIFSEDAQGDPFLSQVARLQNSLFWASVFTFGTGVDYHLVAIQELGKSYFLVEPSQHEGCIPPEDFIDLLTGHHENKMHWGYAWTIKGMSHSWDDYMNQSLPPGTVRDVKLYALESDSIKKQIRLVNKEEVWKLLNRLEF